MEQTCPNCGATNRGTSRFCARCGQLLPQPEGTGVGKAEGSLDLPWLQAVQDKAVHETSSLEPEEVEETDGTGAAAQPAQEAPQQGGQAPSQPQQAPPQPQQPSVQTHSAGETPPPAQVPPEQQDEGADKGEPPPPWVVSILEPSAAPSGPEQSYEPEELSHIMPWAHPEQEHTEGAPQAPAPGTPGTPGLPPWLGDVTVQETLSALPPSEQQVTEPVEAELEGVEPFVPPTEEEQVEEEKPEEVPAWLRNIQGAPQPAAQAQPETQLPATDRSVLHESVIGEPTDAFGAPPTRDVPVRPPRAGAVETLAALMQPVVPEASRRVIPGDEFMPAGRAEAGRRGGWRSRLLPDGLIFLLVLVVLLTVLIVQPPFGEVPAPAAPGVLQFYNAVEAVPAGKPVLIVYDWDASRSGEMSILAQVVMHHIMERKLPFATVSTVPQGPGFAQQITDQMLSAPGANYGYSYGREYLVLGYLPGNEAALRSLVTDFQRTLPLDYVNGKRVDSYTLAQGGSIGKIEDFGLIVDLASSEAELRNWIEQVASRTNVPLVAAVSQGLDPFARPYLGVPGAKLSAIISGVAGANQYMRQLELAGKGGGALNSTTDLNTRLNAQSVAALFVGLIIVAAFVAFGTRRIMRR